MAKDQNNFHRPSCGLPADRAFVIQFDSETAPAQNRFAGRVEHIHSGQALHFQSLPELETFVEQILVSVNNSPDINT